MNITKELLEKAQTAKSAEELLEIAKAENIEMTAEEAAEAFAKLNKSGELSDDELDNVAGGCSKEEPVAKTKFNVHDYVVKRGGFHCFTCDITRAFWVTVVHNPLPGKVQTYTVACPKCGVEWVEKEVPEYSLSSFPAYLI